MAKELNKNAFSEKLIHRYLIERYYFADKKIRNNLLPKKYHNLRINLIVPEESAKNDKTYRADLSIYFKNSDKRIPVEVKWVANGLTKTNQIKHLKNNSGFIVSFENEMGANSKGIPNIEIDYDDFKKWISLNISKLTRESIAEKTTKKFTNLNQYWVVFLRGEDAHANFQRMLKNSPTLPFWAFRQDKTALANILNMRRGDVCLFLFGKGSKQAQGYSSLPTKELTIDKFYIAEITRPYYMALDFKKGTFFEKNKKLPINKRVWPHFVDFKLRKPFYTSSRIQFGKQGKFGVAFANSTNFGGGTPVELSSAEYEALNDRLNTLSQSSGN